MSTPSRKTLTRTSLQERIRLALEQAIQSGSLRPGMAIDEHALARQFSASRTPVREALLLLVAKGLIEIVPRSGIYMRRLDAHELVAMMEGLAELEGVLARLTASRCPADARQRMMQTLEQTADCARRNDPAGYEAANAALHELIYQSSGNSFVVEQTRLARLRIAPYRQRMFEKPGRLVRSQAEHATVIAAICAGQPEAAAEAMRTHILAGGQAFADMLLGAPLPPAPRGQRRRRQP